MHESQLVMLSKTAEAMAQQKDIASLDALLVTGAKDLIAASDVAIHLGASASAASFVPELIQPQADPTAALEYLAVPMIGRGGEAVGLLAARGKARGLFSPADRAVLSLLGTLYAGAAERLQLGGDTQRRRLLDSAQDMLCLLNESGEFVEVSAACERVLGYSAEELQGKSLATLAVPEEEDRTRAELKRLKDRGWLRGLENRCVRKDGQVALLQWTATWSPDDRMMLAIARDISEHGALQERLRQTQRLEALGHLTGGVAHDFNNLLTVILANVETLERSLPQSSPLQALASLSRQAAERGAGLTARLLAFARRQSLAVQPLDLEKLMGGMRSLLAHTVGETVLLDFQPAAGPLPRAMADVSQFETALLNLTVNARDAMPQGGTISVRLEPQVLRPEDIPPGFEAEPGAYVAVIVTDTGEGMPPRVLQQAIEPFFTTKPAGRGSGLGLSMIYGFLRQVGGALRIASEVGKGTEVQMLFPAEPALAVAEPVTMHSPASAAPDEPASGSGALILLVEDDPLVREAVSAQVAGLGHRVIAAPDGPSALVVLEENPDIALLFTDVVMPGGLDGVALAQEARRRRPGLRVLFTSGHLEHPALQPGALPASDRLLSKPYRRAHLAQVLDEVLGS